MSFDQQAREWDNNPMKIKRAEVFAHEIESFFQEKGKYNALEFGCGTGLLSFELRNFFKSITLVDSSKEMIAVLKEKIAKNGLIHFEPIYADLLKETISIKKSEVVYTLMTLHHVLDLNAGIQLFNSLLVSNGYLCIADLVKEDGSFHSEYPEFEGHNGFDKNELSEVLVKNGFYVEYYTECFEIVKEKRGGIMKYPLFLMIAKKIDE